MRLILGSASPRRRELLAQIGVVADDIRPPHIDEEPLKSEIPRAYCERIARQKAHAVEIGLDEIALCADTTVAVGRRILGKPENVTDAVQMLMLLSGRRHRVITSVVVRTAARNWAKTVSSDVRFKRLSDSEISDYIRTDEWRGKAGAYAIQGRAGALIPWIGGSYSAIVGLPLAETRTLLVAAGYHAHESAGQ